MLFFFYYNEAAVTEDNAQIIHLNTSCCVQESTAYNINGKLLLLVVVIVCQCLHYFRAYKTLLLFTHFKMHCFYKKYFNI